MTTGSKTIVLVFSPPVQRHEPVGIANVVVGGLDLEIAAIEAAWLASQACPERRGEVSLDVRVGPRSAGHRDRGDAVEFIAQRLPFLPFEELGERHGLAQGDVHGRRSLSQKQGERELLVVTQAPTLPAVTRR